MAKPAFWNNEKRYYDFKSYLVNRFGSPVYKLQIDAGFTCPNRDGSIAVGGCSYCDGRFSRLRQQGPLPSVAQQIEEGKRLYARMRGAKKFIAYFQTATNTYAPVEKLAVLYNEALSQDGVVGLSVGTRPDAVDDGVIELLSGYARRFEVWIEYGLQSMHDETLRFLNRGHDYATFANAVGRTAERGIRICAHIILGIPGETHDDMIATARAVASLPVDGIKIHCLLVLAGTALGERYERGGVVLMTKEKYVETVCDVLEILPPQMVVQRLTADGYRDIFLAPAWAQNKLAVLNAIERELARRDSWQGKRSLGVCG